MTADELRQASGETATDLDTVVLPEQEWACGYSQHEHVGHGSATLAVWMRDPDCGCRRRADFFLFCDPCWNYRNSGAATTCVLNGPHSVPVWANIVRVERLGTTP